MAQEQMNHRLMLQDRNVLTVSGVTEIISFDDAAVILQTCMGTLTVQGEDLKLKNLSVEGGQAEVRGTVSALIYEEPHQAGGWFRRMLG